MLVYLLNRWVFAKKFEPIEGGYLYRKSPTAPAFLISEDERRDSLRAFRGRYWRSVLRLFGAIFGGVLLLAIAAAFLDESSADILLAVGTFALVIMMAVSIIRQQRNWYRLPVEMIGDRAPYLPARTYREASREAVSRRSWPAHIAAGLFLVALAWLFFPQTGAHPNAPWVYGGIVCLFFGLWTWTAWLKIECN